jgi:hypothetical protein
MSKASKLIKEASGTGATGTQLGKGSTGTKSSGTVASPSPSAPKGQGAKDNSAKNGSTDGSEYDFFKYKKDNSKYGNNHMLHKEKKSSLPDTSNTTKFPSFKNIIKDFLPSKH